MNIATVEEAYQAIASELSFFIGARSFEKGVSRWKIFPYSARVESSYIQDGKEFNSGDSTPVNITLSATDGVFFLRENILRTTGARIWGLIFTLYPNQKIQIEYDYNVPEGYDENGNEIEEDEPLSLDDAVNSLRNKGIDVEVNDPKAQDKG